MRAKPAKLIERGGRSDGRAIAAKRTTTNCVKLQPSVATKLKS